MKGPPGTQEQQSRPRSVLICHHDAPIHIDGITRWLQSWSDLGGVVIVREPGTVSARRLRREWRRVGTLRLLDVLAMRLYYRLRWARRDAAWLKSQTDRLISRYAGNRADVRRLEVSSPNSRESQAFMESSRPDFTVALCKTILAERTFLIPRHGTFVMHPGICPEYRNAHGCFWALASNDPDHVGLSLIRIDRGIDTGPVFGYFRAGFDEWHDSHVRIQHRVLLENLDAIAQRLTAAVSGTIPPIDTTGRASREWGQPWLTALWRWKLRAWRGRARNRA
ncbi:MAG TPA: hypothetical protein VF981_15245 [Gemmatimonadaceae bacterium]